MYIYKFKTKLVYKYQHAFKKKLLERHIKPPPDSYLFDDKYISNNSD